MDVAWLVIDSIGEAIINANLSHLQSCRGLFPSGVDQFRPIFCGSTEKYGHRNGLKPLPGMGK
jgi:hypothetical protein